MGCRIRLPQFQILAPLFICHVILGEALKSQFLQQRHTVLIPGALMKAR